MNKKISLLTAQVVAEIIECLKPSIGLILKKYGRTVLHVVVIDPIDKKSILFDEAVAGKMSDYPKPYNAIALKKAEMAIRTGINTDDIMTKAPHLLAENDAVYQGGVNYRGLVVAASGAQSPVDEAVALMIAVNLSAWCRMEVQKFQAEAAKGGSYIVPEK